MKIQKSILIIILLVGFFSCTKDEETFPKPTIDLTELGLENSQIAYTGGDMHVEADIIAEGQINGVRIQVKPDFIGDFEIDSTYTLYNGLKNTEFHHHLEIESDANTGAYTFTMTVYDEQGQSTSISRALTIESIEDLEAPEIAITMVPDSINVYGTGDIITVTGLFSDNLRMGGLYVALVHADQLLTDQEINSSNTITMLHEHEFENEQSILFAASISVGSAIDNNEPPKPIDNELAWKTGNYYVLVKGVDAYGNNWAYSNRMPLTINL